MQGSGVSLSNTFITLRRGESRPRVNALPSGSWKALPSPYVHRALPPPYPHNSGPLLWARGDVGPSAAARPD